KKKNWNWKKKKFKQGKTVSVFHVPHSGLGSLLPAQMFQALGHFHVQDVPEISLPESVNIQPVCCLEGIFIFIPTRLVFLLSKKNFLQFSSFFLSYLLFTSLQVNRQLNTFLDFTTITQRIILGLCFLIDFD